MSANNHLDAQALRARLNHPVIDSDGHWIEYQPMMLDYLKKVAGNKAAEGLKSRDEVVGKILRLSDEQRRDEGRAQQAWWPFPTKNTLDRATAMIPKLLYSRLDEFGFDFTVLYPTSGLGLYSISEPEMRQATCRAFNIYIADIFKEYADRMTPAAVIPMHTPEEALAELNHVKSLGLKVIVMGSAIRRPIPALERKGERIRTAATYDVLGIDSPHDYEPVWAKCVELGFAPTFHSAGRGVGFRSSPSNFTYNHIGHFASADEAVCKALFMGGVTRRFPTLKFAFLEGGVGWACQLYADLIGHWKKRNPKALEEVNPANLDRKLLRELFAKYGSSEAAERLDGWESVPEGDAAATQWAARGSEKIDDYAACKIGKASDTRDLFTKNFYFGCEADDPMNAWGFNDKVNPYGARLKALFGSDIGHFDVPDMREVLVEAHELVDDGIIGTAELRDFLFGYPVEFWTGMNPDFFKGTVVEQAVEAAETRHEPEQPFARPRLMEVSMKAVSHIAIGVRDMDRSLKFYRDLLGLKVCLDTMENVGGMKSLFTNPQKGKRRAVYLRFDEGPHSSFLVLSQNPGETPGEAIKLDQVGVHHFAFWVDDLRERLNKLEAAGVPILVKPIEADSEAYGEPSGGKVLTCLFQDPDGIIVQFDQRL